MTWTGWMEVAAAYAADLGLDVWFSPYPMELDAFVAVAES
jgi:hypothetical protein